MLPLYVPPANTNVAIYVVGAGDGVGVGDAPGSGDGVGVGDASGSGDGVGVGDASGSGDGVGVGDGVTPITLSSHCAINSSGATTAIVATIGEGKFVCRAAPDSTQPRNGYPLGCVKTGTLAAPSAEPDTTLTVCGPPGGVSTADVPPLKWKVTECSIGITASASHSAIKATFAVAAGLRADGVTGVLVLAVRHCTKV